MRALRWIAEDARRRRVAEGEVRAADERAAVMAGVAALEGTAKPDELYRVRCGSACVTVHGDELQAVAGAASMDDRLAPGRTTLRDAPAPRIVLGLATRLARLDRATLDYFHLQPEDIEVVYPRLEQSRCSIRVRPGVMPFPALRLNLGGNVWELTWPKGGQP